MKLYEISDQIERVLAENVDRETGEINHETVEALNQLEIERDELALSIAAYIKGERAEAQAILDEAQKLSDRATVHRNRADRLVEYLAYHCEDGKVLENAQAKIHWRHTPYAAVIIDEKAVPEDFWKEKIVRTIDKVAVRDTILKDQTAIPGATVRRQLRLYIK